jgi:hypothetical protein
MNGSGPLARAKPLNLFPGGGGGPGPPKVVKGTRRVGFDPGIGA